MTDFRTIRPVAPAGDITFTGSTADFDIESSVVDARVLSDNWKTIFAKVNGNITFADTVSAYLSEVSGQAVLDRSHSAPYGNLPVSGSWHNHDGVNSAPLAEGVITGFNYYSKPELSNIMRGGSFLYRSLMFTGTVKIPVIVAGGSVDNTLFRIPFSKEEWGVSDTYLRQNVTASGAGSVRALGSIRFEENTPAASVIGNLSSSITVNLSGTDVTWVGVTIVNSSGTNAVDVFFDWVLLCLI